jgi:hypothetical protein
MKEKILPKLPTDIRFQFSGILADSSGFLLIFRIRSFDFCGLRMKKSFAIPPSVNIRRGRSDGFGHGMTPSC